MKRGTEIGAGDSGNQRFALKLRFQISYFRGTSKHINIETKKPVISDGLLIYYPAFRGTITLSA